MPVSRFGGVGVWEGLPLKPYSVISWADMITHTGRRIYDTHATIDGMLQHATTPALMQHFGGAAKFKKQLEDVVLPEAKALGLNSTTQFLEQTISNLGKIYPVKDGLLVELRTLERIMRNEASGVMFVYIPFCKFDYLNWQKLFPKSSLLYTPENYDMEHAASCFAVGSYTATVFHLVRLLEKGLRKIEKGLSIPEEKDRNKQTWGHILGRIGAEVLTRDNHKPPLGSWKSERDFYTNAKAFLGAVKQAWRDDQVHSGRIYDPAEAKVIFDATIQFMEHLTTKFTTLVIV